MTHFLETGLLENLIPTIIGGSMGILALMGLQGFIKEATVTFRKRSHVYDKAGRLHSP